MLAPKRRVTSEEARAVLQIGKDFQKLVAKDAAARIAAGGNAAAPSSSAGMSVEAAVSSHEAGEQPEQDVDNQSEVAAASGHSVADRTATHDSVARASTGTALSGQSIGEQLQEESVHNSGHAVVSGHSVAGSPVAGLLQLMAAPYVTGEHCAQSCNLIPVQQRTARKTFKSRAASHKARTIVYHFEKTSCLQARNLHARFLACTQQAITRQP